MGLAGFIATSLKAFGFENKSLVPSVSNEPSSGSGEFPYVSSVKFYFPKDKSQEQVQADIKSWCDPKKFKNVTTALIDQKLMNPNKERIVAQDHIEFRLYFSSQASCETYKELMSKNNVVQAQRQADLGYRVKCDYFYI